MPYREPIDFPPVDGEELAVKQLAARASRLRRTIIVPSIVAGLAGAVVGYLLVREVQFAMFHAQMPWLSGVIGCIPPLTAALRIAQKLGDAAVGKRAPAWVEEQIRLHNLPPGVLDEYLTVL
ncbi:MAG TPA: hypothetical protein VM925_32300 [Labilithrix sp.]|nr:hypothetical protein [Labilithrix sp.]